MLVPQYYAQYYATKYAERKLASINKEYGRKQPFFRFPKEIIERYAYFANSGCKECGGKCCKEMPCSFAPWDFLTLNDETYIRRILETGVLTIADFTYTNYTYTKFSKNYYYILRPSCCDEKNRVVGNNSNRVFEGNSRCVFLSENGCMLEPEFRPTVGLIYDCQGQIFSEERIYEKWIPYQDLLRTLFEEKNLYSSFKELKANMIPQERPPATEKEVKQFKKALLSIYP